MIRSSVYKTILFVQIIALMICTFPYSAAYVTAQETTTTATSPADTADVQALQDQRAQLQQQANEIQLSRQTLSDSLDGLLKQKESIEKQIELKKREIDINTRILQSLDQQINSTDEQLILAEQSMLLKRQAILGRFEVLRQKLRTLSKVGRINTVQVLLSADSFVDYLINIKMISRVTESEQATLNSLEAELADIRDERTKLQEQQTLLEETRRPHEAATSELETAKNDLLALHNEAMQIEDLLMNNLTYYRGEYTRILTEQQAVNKQIASVLGTYDVSGMVAPTIFQWPTPECTIITSSYKSRWGKWHYGVDIASFGDAEGKPIYAAADGTVIFADADDSGYGNYVIIDHGCDVFGRRIVTLYGHCRTLLVEAGDTVLGGQTMIALVGDTGVSTGAHLHFEVRVDGNAVDPVGEGFLLTNGITIAD